MPQGAVAVTLSTSDTGAATVPASVSVSGTTAATFTIQTSPVGANTDVTISATYGGITRQVVLHVTT
jgi:hypothetical protein